MRGIRGKIIYLLITLLISGMFYCTNNNISGGGGIDIGNPAKVCVIDSLYAPVAGASVKIIPSELWFENAFKGNSLIADSSTTGVSGHAFFDSVAIGRYNFQVDHSSGGALVTDVLIGDSQKVNVIMIKSYGAISGTISSTSGKPVDIRIAGTAYGAAINDNGSYLLSSIPRGSFVPLVMASDSQWTFTNVVEVFSSNTTASAGTISFNTLLIDDFEDSGSTMKMGKFINSGHIYTAFDKNSNASAQYQVVPEEIRGKALNGVLVRNGTWTLVGFFLGTKPDADSVWDFHLAKGLSFYAKGTGKLNISIESDSIEKMGYHKHYSADIALQPQWHHFFLPFDSLRFYTDANPDPDIPWEQASRSIKRIEFNALEGDTVQFCLDELKVEGISFSKAFLARQE